MQAIKALVLSSKDLQRDIVESGRVSTETIDIPFKRDFSHSRDGSSDCVVCVVHQGAASMKEFYVKNSRWTEGLISASKAVGWGATVMV